jgi:hypothetical protein
VRTNEPSGFTSVLVPIRAQPLEISKMALASALNHKGLFCKLILTSEAIVLRLKLIKGALKLAQSGTCIEDFHRMQSRVIGAQSRRQGIVHGRDSLHRKTSLLHNQGLTKLVTAL